MKSRVRTPTMAELKRHASIDPQKVMIEGLWVLGGSVFRDRNAKGMPKKDRSKIKALVRPHLRECIGHLRRARNAWRSGDQKEYRLETESARMCWAYARSLFFQPYANHAGKHARRLADQSAAAAQTRSQKLARPVLDDLIRGCIHRGEPMRVKAWVDDFEISKSAVYRRIQKIKSS